MRQKGNKVEESKALSVVVRTFAFTLNKGKWVGSLNLGEVLRISYKETRVKGRLVYLHHSLQQQTEGENKSYN